MIPVASGPDLLFYPFALTPYVLPPYRLFSGSFYFGYSQLSLRFVNHPLLAIEQDLNANSGLVLRLTVRKNRSGPPTVPLANNLEPLSCHRLVAVDAG